MLKKIKQKLIPITLGLVIVFAAFWFETTQRPTPELIRHRLNDIVYDIRMQVGLTLQKNRIDSDVLIVDVDEQSLKAEGRWPWSRSKMGALLDTLRDMGAAVVAFDVIFSEPELNISSAILTELPDEIAISESTKSDLKKLEPHFDYDSHFAKHIESDTVLGFILTYNPENAVGVLPEPILTIAPDQVDRVLITNMPGYIAPLPVLLKQEPHTGFVTNISDEDGIIRHYPIVLRHGDKVFPSLALEAVRQYLFLDEVKFNFVEVEDDLVLTGVELGQLDIPTDEFGQVLVPYQGFDHTYTYISATDILNNNVDPERLNGKIVFVGTSAIGLGDLHATPFDSSFPGVEIHATVADIMLHKTFPVEPDWDLGAIVMMIFFFGFVFAIIIPFMNVLLSIFVPMLVMCALIYFNLWLWSAQGIYLSGVIVYIMMFLISLVNIAYGYIFEARKRHQLKDMFGQYVPAAHVEQMSESSKAYTFEGESRDMSVLFADIRSFTTISEKLEPNQLKRLLNDYFTPMTKIIFDNGGTIDKYVGDMIMAFWGAPLENPNHKRDAVMAGFEMLKAAKEMHHQFSDMGVEEINIGVGINSGPMNVGDMGSTYRRSYTVLGDSVNLGSRLESATKFYGVSFIISEETYEGCRDTIVARHLDRVKVKGKADAVEIYEPICTMDELTPELKKELEQLDQAQSLYLEAQWDEASARFKKLHEAYPDVKIYGMYIERIQALKESGIGPDWDGCFVREEK